MANKSYDDTAGLPSGLAPEIHSAGGGDDGVGVGDRTNDAWFAHSTGKRIDTDTLIARSLAEQYPQLQLTIAPRDNGVDLLRYAAAGHASSRAIGTSPGSSGGNFSPVAWTVYIAPARRIDGDPGFLAEKLNFGKFAYRWRGREFLLYVADGRDGTEAYSARTNQYILSTERGHADGLLLAAGSWANELHEEVWVFDQGYWQKNAALFRSIAGATWGDVILDPAMKSAIIEDHTSFFDSRDTYARLKVPWKRGIIYHGPPGNGKTISIKATMHMLYDREDPVPTLYVRSLASVSCLVMLSYVHFEDGYR